MPQPATNHQDLDLDHTPATPPPVGFAEQALLGALLIDPQQRAAVRGLEPEHFYEQAHRAIFAAVESLPLPDSSAHAEGPVWLSTVLEAARPAAPGLGPSLLHLLVQACPQPRHAAAYARIIRADHARRTLHKHAETLARTATGASLPDPTGAVIAQADSIAKFLDEMAVLFTRHPGSLPRTPLPTDPTRDDGEEALNEEQLLLASATAHPETLEEMRWLQPQDFALPLHAGLFQCLTALARRGDPVDPITVLWEAQHQNLLTGDLTASSLVSLLSEWTGSPEHWGQRILHRALLFTARRVAHRIQAFADDPANTPHQLATGSRRSLAQLHAVRVRYERTRTRAGPPATPRPSRAGPPAVTTTPPIAAGISR